MARKIAGGLGQQAAFALALACLFMPVLPQYTVRLARDANYVA